MRTGTRLYHLSTVRDDHSSEVGVRFDRVKNVDNNVSVTNEGRLLAHDIVEHMNGLSCIGTINDELQAMAGVWLTRGQHNDISRSRYNFHAPDDSLASDIVVMAIQYIQGEDFTQKPRRKKSSDCMDEVIEYCMGKIKEGVQSEFGKLTLDESKRLKEFIKLAPHYIREGAFKFEQQWQKEYHANTLFWNIAEAADKYVKHSEEGMCYKLRVNYDDLTATMEEYYPRW